MKGYRLCHTEGECLLQGRKKDVADFKALFLPEGGRHGRPDGLGDKEDLFIVLPFHVFQHLPALFQGQGKALFHLFPVPFDFFRKSSVGDPDHFVSVFPGKFLRVIEQGLVACIPDPGENNGDLF